MVTIFSPGCTCKTTLDWSWVKFIFIPRLLCSLQILKISPFQLWLLNKYFQLDGSHIVLCNQFKARGSSSKAIGCSTLFPWKWETWKAVTGWERNVDNTDIWVEGSILPTSGILPLLAEYCPHLHHTAPTCILSLHGAYCPYLQQPLKRGLLQ